MAVEDGGFGVTDVEGVLVVGDPARVFVELDLWRFVSLFDY